MTVPAVPPAPPRFSTMTDWPSCSVNSCAIRRAETSVKAPGANGTTMRITWFGQLAWAEALPPAARGDSAAPMSRARRLTLIMLVSSDFLPRLRRRCYIVQHGGIFFRTRCEQPRKDARVAGRVHGDSADLVHRRFDPVLRHVALDLLPLYQGFAGGRTCDAGRWRGLDAGPARHRARSHHAAVRPGDHRGRPADAPVGAGHRAQRALVRAVQRHGHVC